MAIFLDWFASHNTLVIQSLAAVVALLIVVLIFRLLFANQEAAVEDLSKKVTYAQLEEKLNKLLEQQAQMKVSVSAATEGVAKGEVLGDDAMAALSGDPAIAAAVAVDEAAVTEQIAELNRLRAEITTLKDSLKSKEVEITTAKEQAVQSANTDQQDAKLADLGTKITDYETQIETLKNRLSDYEIIAEDIADLQHYKKENQELKNQLANQQSATASAAPIVAAPAEVTAAIEELKIEEPVVATDELDALISEDVSEAPIVPDDILLAANDALSDEPVAEESQDEDTMPEAMPAEELDNEEAREVSKDVKKADKNLLDEFEKHFAKDDD